MRNNKKVDIYVLFDISDRLSVDAEYFRDSDKDKPKVLAAHFDGTEYTEDEPEEIKQFAAFVKEKRKRIKLSFFIDR